MTDAVSIRVRVGDRDHAVLCSSGMLVDELRYVLSDEHDLFREISYADAKDAKEQAAMVSSGGPRRHSMGPHPPTSLTLRGTPPGHVAGEQRRARGEPRHLGTPKVRTTRCTPPRKQECMPTLLT